MVKALYLLEISLGEVRFIKVFADYYCGEVLLPKDLAVSSSLFPFGYMRECSVIKRYAT